MKVIHGDLIKLALEGEFDVIVHGCNCFCTMGAGIAKQVKKMFPQAYDVDQKTTRGDKNKLGTISIASITQSENNLTIVNGYTQYNWRGSGILVDYGAVQSVFKQIKSTFPGKRIGYPKIGAGLAKGDWEVISDIIDVALEGEDHMLVEYSP